MQEMEATLERFLLVKNYKLLIHYVAEKIIFLLDRYLCMINKTVTFH